MAATNNATMNAFELMPGAASSNGSGFWHGVQVYGNEAFLSESAGRFLSDGLEAGEGVIVVATKSHHDAFAETLTARGLDVPAARAQGQYLPLDAAMTLATFLVNGWPDPARFNEVVGSVIRGMADGRHPRVRVFGEMVSLLWEAEQQAAAIRTEELWNDLLKAHACYLLCAYAIASFRDEVQTQAFLKVCSQHSHVLPAENRVPAQALSFGAVADPLRRG